MQRADFKVSPGLVQNNLVRGGDTVTSSRRRGTKGAPSHCAPAFLIQTIDVIRPDDEEISVEFGFNPGASYEKLIACCKRFMEVEGMEFGFEPTPTFSVSQRLVQLIDYFEDILRQYGVKLYIGLVSPTGEREDVLQYALYRYGEEMEQEILVIYAAPAHYLSEDGSRLFKRFLKFFSESTHIELGVHEYGDNFYLDSIITWWEDTDPYDEDEEDTRKDISTAYREDGEFWNLFDEIESISDVTPEGLEAELVEYISRNCPDDEQKLMWTMLKGIPIVRNMNKHWFDFNPENDGIPDEFTDGDSDNYGSSVRSSAILYSQYDGLCDSLLGTINGELESGVVMSSWNIHQYLTPEVTDNAIREFMEYKDIVEDFALWQDDFYRESDKFDRYGKSE